MFPTAMQPMPMPAMVPPKVQAAQGYLHYAFGIKQPMRNFDNCPITDAATLSGKEQAVYDQALEVLRLYFSGEMDYETQPQFPPPQSGPTGDGPMVPAGV